MARKEYKEALKLGLPLLGRWVEKLQEGVDRFGIKPKEVGLEADSPRPRLLVATSRGRLASIPWTAWIPKPIETGKVLEAPDAEGAPIVR